MLTDGVSDDTEAWVVSSLRSRFISKLSSSLPLSSPSLAWLSRFPTIASCSALFVRPLFGSLYLYSLCSVLVRWHSGNAIKTSHLSADRVPDSNSHRDTTLTTTCVMIAHTIANVLKGNLWVLVSLSKYG